MSDDNKKKDGLDSSRNKHKRRYRLKELLADVKPEHLHGEVPTGNPMGKEVW